MLMPFLMMPFHPSATSTSRPRARGLLLGLVAGAACLGVSTLSAQTSDAELEQLKQRLAEMEAKMKSMEAQVALAGSIAQSRTITGPDGKEVNLKEGPVVLPALDTFTRNFKWHGYVRLGTGFTANGVGQTFDFKTPDIGHGRFRLGNENDLYIETGPILDHMLGDDPEVIDVRFKMTFQIFSGEDKQVGLNLSQNGFNLGIVEAYLEIKNVIKSAPEVTFWGGQRFYDRYDIHPQDYFFLNTSGIGGGVYNIDLGIGSLALAYFGGIQSGNGDFTFSGNDAPDGFDEFNLRVDGGEGSFYRHVFDVRLGDIDFLWGKLKLVAIGSYLHGGDFDVIDSDGTNRQGHVENSWGVGGGFIQQWDLPPSWGKLSYVQIAALYGYGLVDFDPSGVGLGKLNNALNSSIAQDSVDEENEGGDLNDRHNLNPYNNSQRARANIFWVWNPNSITSPWALGQPINSTIRASPATSSTPTAPFPARRPFRISLLLGIRPYYWLWGPFAIQGSFAYAYLSNNRGTGAGVRRGRLAGRLLDRPDHQTKRGLLHPS